MQDSGISSSEVGEFPVYHNSPMAKIDLEPIVAKACHPTRGLGWAPVRAANAVGQYRRWLWLKGIYGATALSPTHDIDQIWHLHILDTRKYAEDCRVMFNGRFLHHNPYAGWESDQAEVEHQVNFQRTKDLYKRHFGTDLSELAELCAGGYCDDGEMPANVVKVWRPTLADVRGVICQ